MLTSAGLEFTRTNSNRLGSEAATSAPSNANEKRWLLSERARMLASDAFSKMREGLADSLTTQEVESFFRIDVYVIGDARERRLARILNAFRDDPEIGEMVMQLADRLNPGSENAR